MSFSFLNVFFFHKDGQRERERVGGWQGHQIFLRHQIVQELVMVVFSVEMETNLRWGVLKEVSRGCLVGTPPVVDFDRLSSVLFFSADYPRVFVPPAHCNGRRQKSTFNRKKALREQRGNGSRLDELEGVTRYQLRLPCTWKTSSVDNRIRNINGPLLQGICV